MSNTYDAGKLDARIAWGPLSQQGSQGPQVALASDAAFNQWLKAAAAEKPGLGRLRAALEAKSGTA